MVKDSLNILPFEKHVIWPICAAKTLFKVCVDGEHYNDSYTHELWPHLICKRALAVIQGMAQMWQKTKYFFCFFIWAYPKQETLLWTFQSQMLIHSGTAVLWKRADRIYFLRLEVKLPSPNVKLKLWAKFFSHICIIGLKPVILSSLRDRL